ncbi:M13 family metallopeptidase [Niabella drilacis]|uniref:Putative endopeptidase n=1 Tax=Niabella drilacis (strain DSM 25811 / CCM 8410 / CCUG 62505 / LMG 26954 / E90) TaxID=1285928 RepID=A0A1G6Q4E9_NIADE|nr:M13 family metallopeptidase [Niabella drilacis]SDC87209.1 putative endopeptidase [Niabella drilacis]
MNRFIKVGIWAAGAGLLLTTIMLLIPKKQPAVTPATKEASLKPGDDFYSYAFGIQVQNTPWGKDQVGNNFDLLQRFNVKDLKSILEKAAVNKKAPAGSVEKRVGDFYAAGMDTMTIEKLGYTPIKTDLAVIDAIKTLPELLKEINHLRTNGIAYPLYGFSAVQDPENASVIIPFLFQGGTSFAQDNYLKDNKYALEIRNRYSKYCATLFGLTGVSPQKASVNAAIIFNIEKQLAAAQLSPVEMRNINSVNNRFYLDDLSKTTPGLDWRTILSELEVKGQDSVLVSSPVFFAAVANLLKTVPLDHWKLYLKWNILKEAAPFLSHPFVKASVAVTREWLPGEIPTPRWERLSWLTDGSIGELLGQLYVKEYFAPATKAKMEELVANLRKAFEIRIKRLSWMESATRQKALAKLAAIRLKIGYPDKWENYEGLEINRGTFFKNIRAVRRWQYLFMISWLGKPANRERWETTPPTVNAYYNPIRNEIVFPAGIFRPPFFDANADDAVNYGGIGAVIGHEMTHGFDDQGAQYAADGNLKNWWTAEDEKKFKAKTKMVEAQFNKYTVQDSIHVNGKLTLGENIADLGGLSVAYEAFKMTPEGRSGQKTGGLTPDQRFFLSWAQLWKEYLSEEDLAQSILVNPHPPGRYRIIGPLVNMDAWYKAFQVKPGDKLYKKPGDRIRIW